MIEQRVQSVKTSRTQKDGKFIPRVKEKLERGIRSNSFCVRASGGVTRSRQVRINATAKYRMVVNLESSQNPFFIWSRKKTTTPEDFFSDLMDFTISQIHVWILTVVVTSNKLHNFLTFHFSNYRKSSIIPVRVIVKKKKKNEIGG